MATCAENSSPGNNELERIYRAEFEGLYRYARRILKDSEEAYDVVQDAFVRLHTMLFERPDQPPSRALIYTLVRNLAIDRMRRAGTRMRLTREAETAGLSAPVTPESGLMEREEQELVRQALATLGMRDFECLTLREAGLSYAEIGNVLSMPASSVGPTLVRSLAKLRKAFFALERQKGSSGPLPAARRFGTS